MLVLSVVWSQHCLPNCEEVDQSWRQPSVLGPGTNAFSFDQEGVHFFGGPLQHIGSHLGVRELLDLHRQGSDILSFASLQQGSSSGISVSCT